MSQQVTTEQKLQLIRQIRSRYQENQCDMDNRERILGGYEAPQEPVGGLRHFKLRFLLALLLFLAVVAMDMTGARVAGVTTEQLYQFIAADYEEKVDRWIETLAQAYGG